MPVTVAERVSIWSIRATGNAMRPAEGEARPRLVHQLGDRLQTPVVQGAVQVAEEDHPLQGFGGQRLTQQGGTLVPPS